MSLVKKYIIWVYFFIYPLTNAFLPDINLGFVRLNPVRFYLLPVLVYLLHLFFIKHGKLKFSKGLIFLGLFYVFALFNSYRMGHFAMSNVLNYAFPFFAIVLFENLDFNKEDMKQFFFMLTLLAAAVVVVSLYQKYVNNFFYAGTRGQRWLYRYMYGGTSFRHASIFRSIDFYQAGVAMGMLSVIFMFRNFRKIEPRYIALCFMMLISTYLTYTRSNWIIPLIGFIMLLMFKPLQKKIIIIPIVISLGIFAYLNVFPSVQESDVYQSRVTVDTYEGRFESLDVYFTHFWGHNMMMGWGIDSAYSGMFREFRRPEVHNGYLEVLFQTGFIGVFLYFAFWYYLFWKCLFIYQKTGNGVFLVFIAVFIALNFIYKFINMGHYGYQLMIFYMYMYYNVYIKNVEKEEKEKTLATD